MMNVQDQNQEHSHALYMEAALEQAHIAERLGEVPIGAVIVRDREIIGRGYNLRESKRQALAHAEIMAIEQACERLGAWRLLDCVLYVTLEPCPMCAGAILQARIPLLVFGTADPKAGCCGSLMNLLHDDRFNHRTEIIRDVMQPECSGMLTDFFRRLREKKRSAE